MSNWPRVEAHTFHYKTCPAVNIRIRHLPLTHEENDAIWSITTNETLARFMWEELADFIDERSDFWGIRMYTGGRSNGWLYVDVHREDATKEHTNCLSDTAVGMLEIAKDHIRMYLDPETLLWGNDFTSDMHAEMYLKRATLTVDGNVLATIKYSDPPSSGREEATLLRQLLVKALRSAIGLTDTKE